MANDLERVAAPAEVDPAGVESTHVAVRPLGEGYDTSFEHELDDEPGLAPPIFVDTPATGPVKLPIIPAHLQTLQGVKSSAKRAAGVTGYRAGYHGLRLPQYLTYGLFWAIVGVGRVFWRQIRWAWAPEEFRLLQSAANSSDIKGGGSASDRVAQRRKARGLMLLGETIALAVAVLLLVYVAPLWVQIVVGLALVPVLARVGRPKDKRIVSAAVVQPRHRKLTADIVLRAYYSAKLGDPEKPGQQITFGSQMSRDNTDTGSQVLVDVPYGTPFSKVMSKREDLASGLDVALSQVYLTSDKSSNRRHTLYVADVDPLGISAGRTPLLDCKPRDIWNSAPFGLDERGLRVRLPLMWTSVLIGAQPRKGKTFCARSLALFAALDPYTRISVFDGKGSPDWRKFALVAYTYGFGLLPDRIQGDPVQNLLSTLRKVKREILERNQRLSEMDTAVCPEGKLTRDIARDRRYNMPVWVLILDEFQDFLSTGDEELDREIAEHLVFLVKQGPSAGIIVISSTQKPSGLGSTGKVSKLFTDFRDQHQTRFALKTGSWQVSESVLGSGSYSEGYDSSALPVGDGQNGTVDYRGIGILYDSPAGNFTVRTHKADGQDAEKILLAARRLRERVGLLDGMAAGEKVVQQARDPLADSIDAFRSGETFLSWETLAVRLAEIQPEGYAQATADAVSKTLRGIGLGIESKAGAERGAADPKARPRGVYLDNLRRALTLRESQNNR
jgi:DNA segregation ATPase FtsK/SpoIIIE, S-DNA-T family